MSPKKEKEALDRERDDGSRVAFLEAAQHCREKASQYFLNHKDEAAQAIRELVQNFLNMAGQCDPEEDP